MDRWMDIRTHRSDPKYCIAGSDKNKALAIGLLRTQRTPQWFQILGILSKVVHGETDMLWKNSFGILNSNFLACHRLVGSCQFDLINQRELCLGGSSPEKGKHLFQKHACFTWSQLLGPKVELSSSSAPYCPQCQNPWAHKSWCSGDQKVSPFHCGCHRTPSWSFSGCQAPHFLSEWKHGSLDPALTAHALPLKSSNERYHAWDAE